VEIACTFPWLHFIAHSKNHYIEEKKRGFWRQAPGMKDLEGERQVELPKKQWETLYDKMERVVTIEKIHHELKTIIVSFETNR
jgi:hypothetical protein